MVPIVFTEHRAVRGAKMAHPIKLPDSSSDDQLFRVAVPDDRSPPILTYMTTVQRSLE
jgi:hypothetical protein